MSKKTSKHSLVVPKKTNFKIEMDFLSKKTFYVWVRRWDDAAIDAIALSKTPPYPFNLGEF